MPSNKQSFIIATRGSALALAQANLVFEQCRTAFPRLRFEIKIIKTTGDRLQTVSLANANLPKGLFTKELEVALLRGQADLAVHSLKDLPTDLPAGLKLGAISKRADVRDVLIYRDASAVAPEFSGFQSRLLIKNLPQAATIATSSQRRRAQLLEQRPDLKIIPIRGNVPTRLQKLAEQPGFDAIILAAAGLERLNFQVHADGHLSGDAVPEGLLATKLEPEEMLPCVGQAALGIEVRTEDERMAPICERLNHYNTQQCVSAERAFLKGMGGGCQIPVAAYAQVMGEQLHMRAVSFLGEKIRRGEARRAIKEAEELGRQLAAALQT
jgi:hydroxymethylbilane synthase